MLPLILIPGLLSTAVLWDRMRDHLPPAWPVQALDPLDQPAIGDMAQAILADAPPTFALCGHSMGGYVCLELIRRAPERVRALVLVNTSARPDTPEQRQARLDAIRLAQRGALWASHGGSSPGSWPNGPGTMLGFSRPFRPWRPKLELRGSSHNST